MKFKARNPGILPMAAAFLLLATAGPAPAMDLSDMAVNNWVELKPRWKFPVSAAGGAFQERGWGTMRFRTAGKSVIFYEGYGPSDHGQYCIYGNSLYEYHPPTDTVELVSLSNYYCNTGNPPSPLPLNATVPTPMDRHTYSQFAYSPSDDRLYLAHGASGSGMHPHDLWAWSFQDRKWENRGAAPWATQGWDLVGEGNLILNSNTNELYMFRNRQAIQIYNVASKTWKAVAPKGATSGVVGAHGAYDTKRNRFVFYGNIWTSDDRGTTTFVFFDVATSTWSEPAVAAAWPPPISYASVEYNPKWDVYMLHGGWQQQGTWIFNPGSGQWSQLKTVNTTPANGKQMNVVYDPVHDVLINSVKGTMYLLRYVGTGTTAVMAPEAGGNGTRAIAGRDAVEFRIGSGGLKAGARIRGRIRDLAGVLVDDLGLLEAGSTVRWHPRNPGTGLLLLELGEGAEKATVRFSMVR